MRADRRVESTRTLGVVLRLVGPLLQMVGIVLFLDTRDRGRTIAGVSARTAGLGLVAAGLVIVIVGLLLSGRRPKRKRMPRHELDLPEGGDPYEGS